MKAALQGAVSLLRQNPRLWIPVIVATAIFFAVSLLLKVLTYKLTFTLTDGHSGSGSAPKVDVCPKARIPAF